MPRNFDGSTNRVRLNLGSCPASLGGITFAAIVKRNASGSARCIIGGAVAGGATGKYELYIASTNFLTIYNGTTGVSATGGQQQIATADGWVCVAATKTTGTTTPRMHTYFYNSAGGKTDDTWTHANASATLTDGSGTAEITLGTWAASSDRFSGDIAIAGIWARDLTDVEVESLHTGLWAWLALAPAAVWILDQGDTAQNIIDLTGNGSSQIAVDGTLAVSTNSAPVWSYHNDLWIPSSLVVTAGIKQPIVCVMGT